MRPGADAGASDRDAAARIRRRKRAERARAGSWSKRFPRRSRLEAADPWQPRRTRLARRQSARKFRRRAKPIGEARGAVRRARSPAREWRPSTRHSIASLAEEPADRVEWAPRDSMHARLWPNARRASRTRSDSRQRAMRRRPRTRPPQRTTEPGATPSLILPYACLLELASDCFAKVAAEQGPASRPGSEERRVSVACSPSSSRRRGAARARRASCDKCRSRPPAAARSCREASRRT